MKYPVLITTIMSSGAAATSVIDCDSEQHAQHIVDYINNTEVTGVYWVRHAESWCVREVENGNV